MCNRITQALQAKSSKDQFLWKLIGCMVIEESTQRAKVTRKEKEKEKEKEKVTTKEKEKAMVDMVEDEEEKVKDEEKEKAEEEKERKDLERMQGKLRIKATVEKVKETEKEKELHATTVERLATLRQSVGQRQLRIKAKVRKERSEM